MKRYLFLLALAVATVSHAQLRLPPIFDDHMVLQQQSPVPIWGWSHPTLEVIVNVSWDTTTYRTKSDNGTFWKTVINTPVAGGPHTITIQAGGETRVLQDVLSGEVWLCSGQSNMEWGLHVTNDAKDILDEINDPMIRLFQIPKSAAGTPQVRGEGDWKVCDQESARYFSAVGYFFGKKLQQQLNVPIGLINASWGGTPAEVWLPREKIEMNADLKKAAEKQVDNRPWCPSAPGVVYNAMLHPIIPFRLAGAIWYQGESNTSAPLTYKTLMENLILEWRKQFETDFPFYYVQIAPWSGYGDVETGTLLREQQVKMLGIPKTGMVVISDVVEDPAELHPRFKKPVGERLANVALGDHYGKTGIVYRTPLYKSMKIEKKAIRISFDHVPSGLAIIGREANEFMIAGEDQKFYPAKAKIEGNTIIVLAKEVKAPVAVRFGWRNGALPNLFSRDGLLPVPAFRTDDWPMLK
ncbi:MAG TPA: sialate O-acetylesterase [Ohtaekwangia sp.]|nr:sialate O-acetylesterase [Ohtaekwangia sp.]